MLSVFFLELRDWLCSFFIKCLPNAQVWIVSFSIILSWESEILFFFKKKVCSTGNLCTSAFPWDNSHLLVYSRSALGLLLPSPQRLWKRCTRNSRTLFEIIVTLPTDDLKMKLPLFLQWVCGSEIFMASSQVGSHCFDLS